MKHQHHHPPYQDHREPTLPEEEEEYYTPIEERFVEREDRTSDRRLTLYRPPEAWEAWARPQEETAEQEHQTPEVVLFTFGYLMDYAEETLQALITWGSLIADIRYNPTSRKPEWRQAALRRRFGERYRHLKALGNATYKTKGLITLSEPEEGIAQVVDLLSRGQSVTLLCACRDPEHCHRSLVASLIRERLPEVSIRHLLKDNEQMEEQEHRKGNKHMENSTMTDAKTLNSIKNRLRNATKEVDTLRKALPETLEVSQVKHEVFILLSEFQVHGLLPDEVNMTDDPTRGSILANKEPDHGTNDD